MSNKYPLNSLTAFSNIRSILFNEVWLRYIAYTKSNIQSSSLQWLHQSKDLELQINSITLNPKEITVWNCSSGSERKTHCQTLRLFCKRAAVPRHEPISSSPRKPRERLFPWEQLDKTAAHGHLQADCPVTSKGWAHSFLEHESNFKPFPSTKLSDGWENDKNFPKLLQLELKKQLQIQHLLPQFRISSFWIEL